MRLPRIKGHGLPGGARLRTDLTASGYWVRCHCGWESDLCATAVLADAAGEQHLQLQASRARRASRPLR